MNAAPPCIALTPGEPAGIGPDLCLQLACGPVDAELVVVADPDMLAARAADLGLDVTLEIRGRARTGKITPPCTLPVLPVAAPAPVHPGRLDKANAPYVLETLRRAVGHCLDGEFDALVTGPVHKGIVNEAGIPFSGHTEFLARLTDTRRPVMMLVGNSMRVALVTTHLPLAEVSDAITRERLAEVVRVLHRDLERRFGIPQPRILVCGLNPHAGEGGHIGREENEVIAPVLEKLRDEGLNLFGPLPADTIFTPRHLDDADAVLAMYHDQGLPVLKHSSFGHAVNITLGLPIIRTSVDHGTALELARTGRADLGSLQAAFRLAVQLASKEKRTWRSREL